MNILIEQLTEIEKNALNYYTILADKCAYNEGVKTILTLLAQEQKKQLLLLGTSEFPPHQEIDASFFTKSREILHNLADKVDAFSCDIDQIELYKHAKELQSRALELYRQVVDKIGEGEIKALWSGLMNGKQQQVVLIDNILELLLRPEQWVESPEFNSLDDY